MADIKQIKIGDATYNLEPYSEYIKPTVNSEYYPKFIQTKYSKDSSNWYGKDYPMYGFWETNTICKITVDNYSTKVDMAVKDADQNVITDTYATKTAVTQEIKDAIDGLIDGAPGTLNTLKELSAAIGDDKDYAATVTNLITDIDTKVTNEKTRAEAAEKTLGEKIGENTDAIAVNANSFKTSITGLSVNGRVITYTKGDGTTGTITTQDTNTSDNTHLFRLDTRNLNKGPYDTDNYLSKVTWHLKNNSAIGITGQDNYSGLLQLTPWGDDSGGSSHQLAFGTNGAIYHRYGKTSWSKWSALAHESWVSSNYTTLTSHNTLAKAVSTNTTGISTLNTTVSGHTTSISNNATNIAANTTAIADEKTRAEGAESRLSTSIKTNAIAIEAHGTRLTGAETNIDTLEGYFTNGVANTAAKLSTVSKTAWGKTFWTSGGIPASIDGDMTNVGSITMGGSIKYKGTKSTYNMIKFIDNTEDTYGNGISIGGGGTTIIGGGESSDLFITAGSGGNEKMIIANDTNIEFYSNCQSGIDTAKLMTLDTNGTLTAPKFSGPLTGNVTGTADKSNWLNTNTDLTYGASGLNYFNINGTAGNTKANNTPTSAWYHILRMNHANSGGYLADIAVPLNDVGGVYWRQIRNGGFYGWYKFLDSNNYTSYALALDGTNTMTGKLNLLASGNNETNIGDNGIRWGTDSLPQDEAPRFVCTIDAFDQGGRQKWAQVFDLAASVAPHIISGTAGRIPKFATANTISDGWQIRNNNTGHLEYTGDAADGGYIPTINKLAYWNGRYNATSSNLTYCKRGYIVGTSATSCTENTVPRYSGNGGQTIKTTGVTIDDYDNIKATAFTCDGNCKIAPNHGNEVNFASTGADIYFSYRNIGGTAPSGYRFCNGSGATTGTIYCGALESTGIKEGGTALSSKYGKLETVTTNTSNITTLQGYFTGGVAKEAAKVSKSLTFKGDGSGVSAGSTYNGSTAITISHQSVGALSYTAKSTDSKTYFIGKQTVGSTCTNYYNANVYFSGSSVFAGSFYATSDKRLKENIKDADTDYYDFISNIRLVKYNWKDDEDKIVQHGVIAQELKETAPEDLKDHLVSGVETDTDYLAVNDGKMVYIALGALQQQLKINQQLESRIARLEQLLGV